MATVPNPGVPGSPVDLGVGAKSSGNAFQANGQLATKIATTTTSQAYQLNRVFNGDNVIRVFNSGSGIQRFKFGRDSSVVATVNDKGLPPGAVELWTVGPNVGWVAVIGDSAGTIEFDCGKGV